MKEIILNKGYKAIVDDDDFEWVSKYKWYLSNGYAKRNRWINKKNKNMYLHREIMYAEKGQEIDHINNNRLDNRKSNLRFCKHNENSYNRLKNKFFKGKIYSSKYKGVSWNKEKNKWSAKIGLNYKMYSIGYYINEKDAANTYNKKANELFGKFSLLNTI